MTTFFVPRALTRPFLRLRPIGLALRAATLSRGERALTRNNLQMANLQRALKPATTCPFEFMRERAEQLQFENRKPQSTIASQCSIHAGYILRTLLFVEFPVFVGFHQHGLLRVL